MEGLPTELWFDIFTYLNTRERFNSFYNLNEKINQLLINSHYFINFNHDDENSQYIYEHILPQLTYSRNVSSLRLENFKKVNLTRNFHLFHLTSITFRQVYITNDILNLLKYHADHLIYLNMSRYISSQWKILLEIILSLPKLQICYLQLGIGLCPIKTTNVSKSPIKYLSLFGRNQSCCVNSLAGLLNYLPDLRSLTIQCDQLKSNEIIHNPHRKLSYLFLKLNHLPELFNDFLYFILKTMPNLEKLEIKCYNPLQNLVYINVYQWMKLIDLLTNLKELILIVTLNKSITRERWDRRYKELIKYMHLRHVTLKIEHNNKDLMS